MSLFEDLGLRQEILKAISEMGFEQPTPIQEETLPFLFANRGDLVALAQTGTGKTAGYGLPILEQTDLTDRSVQTLVLCPTRELCMQITGDMQKFARYLPQFKIIAVYGGTNIVPQMQALKSGVHMVVATPGRALDLLRRKALKIGSIRWLVLDEADEMLSIGFKDDLDTILSETPKGRHTLLFSATMPREIQDISRRYMKEPVEIAVGRRNAGAEQVNHEYYMVHARDRYAALKRIIDFYPRIYGIVFCRTRAETQEVADKLMGEGYDADVLHGDLSQAQRDFVMGRFRQKHLQLLVATDVAARGLDVNDLTHIINYNLPDDLEVYIHRSGRTGRAGKTGLSISIVHTREQSRIAQLEKIVRKKFLQKQVPGGREICEKQLFNQIDKVERVEINESQIGPFLDVIMKKLAWLDREELVKRFVSVEFNRFLSYYEGAPDLNVRPQEPKAKASGRKSTPREKIRYSNFYINLGTKNNLNPGALIGLINGTTGNRDISIGKIELMKRFSFFQVDSRFEHEIINSLQGARFGSVRIMVELRPMDK
ncbi:MAG: DEAD/DEAH box helicase [Bacteroidales bacterium]